jgi:hypothetical protein
VVTEIRLLRAIQAELAVHAAAREQHYRHARPRAAGPVAARVRRDQRPGSGRRDGPPWPVRRWVPVQVLCRADPGGPARPARPTARASQ